eukprot:2887881-Karenia_brevis.AAC.1
MVMAPYPRPIMVGIQSLATLVYRRDEARNDHLFSSDGYFDRNNASRHCLSALPDEYQQRSVIDGSVPDLFESMSAVGITTFIFNCVHGGTINLLEREVLVHQVRIQLQAAN